jgi:ubiquinone/menaquinone biosynthesis C-methylase UbiE
MQKSYSPEIMDDFSIKDGRIDKALKELKTINYFLGGNSTTKAGIKKILKIIPGDSEVKILDAGSGASDVLLSVKHIITNPKYFCMDINIRTCNFMKANSPSFNIICGNVLKFPIKNEEYDIAHASLFLHHFSEEKIKEIMKNLINSAKYGAVINDLRRSVLAYWGIKILTMLFSKSEMVKNDGPLSVKRAFTKKELLEIINDLNIERFQIKRKWAFRWLIVIYKNKL